MCCPSTHTKNLKLLVNFHKEIESMKVKLKECQEQFKNMKHSDMYKLCFENEVDQKDMKEMQINNLKNNIKIAEHEYNELYKEIIKLYKW